jgi:Spy/CpxP family protein refolding chaperone
MRRSSGLFFVVLSVALNIAFVAAWLAHAARPHLEFPPAAVQLEKETGIWCPLHRELGVDRQQWQEIEPRLKEFQAAADELCQRIGQLRSELIDFVATEEPDLATIHAKQDKILATKRQMQQLVVAHLLAEKAILDPDQQEHLFRILRNRTGRNGPPLSGRPTGGGGVRKVFEEGSDS